LEIGDEMSRFVSIIIPTYNRPYLLNYNLKALENQTYNNCEVILVVGLPRPNGDGTEELIIKYQKNSSLNIKLFFEKKGVIRQLNKGIESAKGDIIMFTDDDAIPPPDWVKNHVQTYSKSNIGGVAGDVISAKHYFTKISQKNLLLHS